MSDTFPKTLFRRKANQICQTKYREQRIAGESRHRSQVGQIDVGTAEPMASLECHHAEDNKNATGNSHLLFVGHQPIKPVLKSLHVGGNICLVHVVEAGVDLE